WYSRGMRGRLSFSLFAFVECDLLILDESLAGGDVFFREKCLARIEEKIDAGTSILMVTHRLDTLSGHCRQILVLDEGRPVFLGPPEEALARYREIRRARRHPDRSG